MIFTFYYYYFFSQWRPIINTAIALICNIYFCRPVLALICDKHYCFRLNGTYEEPMIMEIAPATWLEISNKEYGIRNKEQGLHQTAFWPNLTLWRPLARICIINETQSQSGYCHMANGETGHVPSIMMIIMMPKDIHIDKDMHMDMDMDRCKRGSNWSESSLEHSHKCKSGCICHLYTVRKNIKLWKIKYLLI